jgi:UDP-2,3-diacylglucosamine hydrolase
VTGPALLLSDLHLPDTASPLRDRFIAFLDGPARGASAVYLLGDVFEFWIGDAEGLRAYGPEAKALRRLADSGVPVGFMHGNRDFMLGLRFAEACDFDLLPDPLVVTLHGVPTLLSHGDIWCTDDIPYQRWRRFSRRPLAQAVYRALPESVRLHIAGDLRGRGDAGRRERPQMIIDVNEDAITRAYTEHGVSRIIHGHTHRPAEHRLQVDGRACERIVLADWRPEHCEVLAIDESGLHRRSLGDS